MSTDTKPIGGFVTGSKFFEVDTGNEYAYDEHGEQWHMTAIGSAAGSTQFDKLVKAISGEGIYFAEQPEDVEGAEGTEVKLSVNVIGIGLTLAYQWQYRSITSTGAWTNSNLTGNATATLTVPVTSSRYNYDWRCAVTYTLGGESVTEYSNFARVLQPASVDN